MTRVAASVRCGWVLTVCLFTATAAAEPTSADRTAAQALFEEARQLLKAGKAAAACPKLEESQRLDPGVGTQLNLASCYEQTRRPASAWSLYLEVASLSRAAGHAEREQLARGKADALRPRLPKLTIFVSEDARALGDLQITRDGAPLRQAQWGSPVPVDPGKHLVRAEAPGRAPWEDTVEVADGGAGQVEIPGLAQASLVTTGTATTPVEEPTSPSSGRSRRTIGLIVAGAGVAGLGTGIAVALLAKQKQSDAIDTHCQPGWCDAIGIQDRKSAVSQGNVATVVSLVGIAAIAAGTVLFVTAPRSAGEASTGSAQREPHASPTGIRLQDVVVGPTTLTLRGSF